MIRVLERIRNTVSEDCLASRIRKEGCSVRLNGMPANKVIIDCDNLGLPGDRERCDYLVVASPEDAEVEVAVLELKRGKLHAGKVVKQLQASARMAEEYVRKKEISAFRPVAVSGSASKHERAMLRNASSTIRFHNSREPVRLLCCKAALRDAFRK